MQTPTSSIDPHGLEYFRVQALIDLMIATVQSGIPIAENDEQKFADLQEQRKRLQIQAQEENER